MILDARNPMWDKALGGVVVKETDKWLVSVTPMIFNDRVLFHWREHLPHHDAGWCYDKGGAAILAALAWDPEVDDKPVGYKKEAWDGR
jgi:hypothetical protein